MDDFQDTELSTAAVLRAITSAKCKLMGGINFEDGIKQDPRRVIIDQNMIALWCVRASLLVKPQGELASDLIANQLVLGHNVQMPCCGLRCVQYLLRTMYSANNQQVV